MGALRITDESGIAGEFRPIAVIEHPGRLLSTGDTLAYYVCDVQTPKRMWFRTNDNSKPIPIFEDKVSKYPAVVLYSKTC